MQLNGTKRISHVDVGTSAAMLQRDPHRRGVPRNEFSRIGLGRSSPRGAQFLHSAFNAPEAGFRPPDTEFAGVGLMFRIDLGASEVKISLLDTLGRWTSRTLVVFVARSTHASQFFESFDDEVSISKILLRVP